MKLTAEEVQKCIKSLRKSYESNKALFESDDIKALYVGMPEKMEEFLLRTEMLKDTADRLEQDTDMELTVNIDDSEGNWIWDFISLVLLNGTFCYTAKESK